MKKTKLKISVFLIVIVNLLMSSLLGYTFDTKDVTLALERAYPIKQIEYSVGKLPIESYVIEYIHREKSQEVAMVKGYYNGFSSEKLIEGRHITFGDYKSAVISKDLASRLHRTYECIGFDYIYQGTVYTIIGVLDVNHKVILTLPDGFQEKNVQRTELKVKLDKVLEPKLSLIRTVLRVDGMNTTSTIVNEWFIQAFRNFAILLLMVMFVVEIIRRFRLIIVHIEQFMADRNEEKIVFVLSAYLKEHIAELRAVASHAVLIVIMVNVAYFVGKDVEIPTYLLPQDPTRISEWVSVIDKLKLGIDYQFAFGVHPIAIKTGIFMVADIILVSVCLIGEQIVARKKAVLQLQGYKRLEKSISNS